MKKRVLVTGADGFIGSHLVEALVAEGFVVRAFVFYNSFNSCGWLDSLSDDINKGVEIFPGDIRDPYAVRKAAEGCGYIYHLAALISIPYSYHSPDSYIETNIKGTLNMLQAARETAVERIFITSTSEVYGTARYVPIDEKHPKQGQSPYSASKIAADSLAESFHKSFGLPIVIIRPFNTYGPRQSARAVIPTIITQLLSGKKEIRLGSLSPTRDLVYVKDTVEGFIKLSDADNAIGEEINIATQREVSIGELAKELILKINPEARIVKDEERIRPEKSEVERLLGSNKKLKTISGWTPKYSLNDGLTETIDWFKKFENLGNYKAGIYNV